MGALASDMARLREEIGHARDQRSAGALERKRQVDELYSETRVFLGDAGAARQAAANEDASARAQALAEVRSEVTLIVKETQAFLAQTEADRADTAAAEAQARADDRTAMESTVRHLFDQFNTEREDFRRVYRETVQKDLNQRLAFAAENATQVTQLLRDLREATESAARATADERNGFLARVREQVAEALKDAQALLAQIHDDHVEMATADAAKRTGDVVSLRANVLAAMQEFAGELKAARSAFFGPDPDELAALKVRHEREGRVRAAAERAAAAAAQRAAAEVEASAKREAEASAKRNAEAAAAAAAAAAAEESTQRMAKAVKAHLSTLETVRAKPREATAAPAIAKKPSAAKSGKARKGK